jgi:membrane associated rhomboid family serine protease
VIPFSDPSEPNRIFPYVNIGLIVVNFVVFFYELSLGVQGTSSLSHFYVDYGLVPCEYTSHCQPYAGTPSPLAVTLFTSIFLHGGWLHILGNMIYLWVFGDNIENSMGHLRYLLFYLLCGLGANALEIFTAVNSAVPGIAGVLGAYLVLYPTSRVATLIPISFLFIPIRLPAWVLIGFWFILQLFNGIVSLAPQTVATGGVAYWAHVGGFITGMILIWIFRRPTHVDRVRTRHDAWRGSAP